MVGVAQLVELRIVTPAVEGSNPFAHPISCVCSSVGLELPASNRTVGGSIPSRRSKLRSRVAQLVEHFHGREEVSGSIPDLGTKNGSIAQLVRAAPS